MGLLKPSTTGNGTHLRVPLLLQYYLMARSGSFLRRHIFRYVSSGELPERTHQLEFRKEGGL